MSAEPGSTPSPGTTAAGRRQAAERVQLICMPFQNLSMSSLSVALLASVLRQRGVAVEETYLHFGLVRMLGSDAYRKLAEKAPLHGELFFAEGYHGFRDDERIEQRLRPWFGPPAEREAKRAAFLEYCLARTEPVRADLIGFTTSFHQLFPALWLAKKIKEARPQVRVVLGGASCVDSMGARISEQYGEADHVVSGYGERPLLDLALGDARARGQRLLVNQEPVQLDALPLPDYAAFLRDAEGIDFPPGSPSLIFESSRGCWWGQKNRCAFCGLNAPDLVYNVKSSARVVEEIRTLWDRYGKPLFAADSVLSRVHLKEAIPALAAYDSKPAVFYEVKANMSRGELRSLGQANIRWVQPGIESLSTPLLKCLRKGVRAIQNIALLKWCRELQIHPNWDFLYAIPGERLEDYQEQIRVIARCRHLPPPREVEAIRLERFSPYFKDREEFGLSGFEPLVEYRLLHPTLSEEALQDVSLYFTAAGGSRQSERYVEDLRQAVAGWKAAYERGDGLFWDDEQGLVRIQDGEAERIEGDEKLPALLAATHDVATVQDVMAATGCDAALIDELVDWGVLFREGNLLVNLAVRLESPT